MKKFIFSFLLCFALLEVHGQVNLVPNPSFEERTGCPQGYPDLDGKLQDWMSFRITPDYMNNCNPQVGSDNQFGFQEPHSGEAYTGVCSYHRALPNASEHLGVKLITPLAIGTKYFVSFYISSGYTPLLVNITTNKMGGLFTTYEYYQSSSESALPNSCQIYTEDVVIDTIEWVKISGSIIADSSYEYLVIGNFFEDEFKDTLQYPYQVVPQISYYYIDDVCVSTDSSFVNNWVGIKDENNLFLKIYPNPFQNDITVESEYVIDKISLINSNGQNILALNPSNNKQNIDMSNFERGIYYLKVENNNSRVHYTKIVKL